MTRSEKKIDLDVINNSIELKDTSQYTISDKKAPNYATFYFNHDEMDMSTENQEAAADTAASSTSAHQTVENVEPVRMKVNKPARGPRPKSVPEERIKILVQQVEELVNSERKQLNKISRVNKWLRLERPDDSCDASGEDDERESQTSEDFDTSTATLRDEQYSVSQNTSFDELNSSTGSQQWLGSITQLNKIPATTGMNHFSISESALHQMNLSTKVLDKFSNYFPTASSTNVNVNSNNSTSSTVEEVSPLITEKSSPIRKKKSRLKKKIAYGKSDTHLQYNPAEDTMRTHLIKSGSFPGYSSHITNNDRSKDNDLVTGQKSIQGFNSETSTTSGADSDDDNKMSSLNFKYGEKTTYLNGIDHRDDSFGKMSSKNSEEHSSSLSEAWDNYQENYLSEPYSESHDSDAARRLLNFGEDYRNFIDSQSDWSAFSDISPRMKRKSRSDVNNEWNSDDESLRQVINDSREQLSCAEKINEQIKAGFEDFMVTKDIEDLISSCDRHIIILEQLLKSSDEFKISVGDKAATTDLLKGWRSVKTRSIAMFEYRRIRKQIVDAKTLLESLSMTEKNEATENHCPAVDIHNEIDACNLVQETITAQGTKLTALNALVHRYTLENQDMEELSFILKTKITELYELYDNARTCVADKLCQIESILPAWKTLEFRLEQLQKDLEEDKKTIFILDSSLADGSFTDQTATSVRDVAKLLSESIHQSYMSLHERQEGSFSDSGISDEGSEQEIGERQRRLSAIRRLIRQLEIGLSPDSKDRLVMREKLEAAEEELKALQLRCRALVVRSAACCVSSVDRTRPSQDETASKSPQPNVPDDSGDPGSDPSTVSYFRRIFRASLYFQVAILAVMLLSCIYEPKCCDQMNNYSWLLSPQLHYDGRPPI